MVPVSTLERRDVLVVAADHVGGHGQKLEVSGREGRPPIGGTQLLVRVRPGRRRVRLPALSHITGALRHPCSEQ
jgi:hypothetical protein